MVQLDGQIRWLCSLANAASPNPAENAGFADQTPPRSRLAQEGSASVSPFSHYNVFTALRSCLLGLAMRLAVFSPLSLLMCAPSQVRRSVCTSLTLVFRLALFNVSSQFRFGNELERARLGLF